MRSRGPKLAEGVALLLLGILLFRFPEASAAAAQEGVRLCLDLLVPSLFPFFVFSSLVIVTGLADAVSRPFQALMLPLFGVGGPGAAALGLGLIGGYPVGARTIAQLVDSHACSREEACRLSRFCNNCGPAFFLGAAGVGIFGSKEAGILLMGANLAAALLMGVLTRITDGPLLPSSVGNVSSPRSSLAAALPDCVRDSFSSTLGVCAYVILFSVLTALADASGLLPLCVDALTKLFPGEHTEALGCSLFAGFLELSTGTAALADGKTAPLALPLAAFLLGWGGLSVHCQSLPFWRSAGVPVGPYLRAKALQGLLSAGFTTLFLWLHPLALPAMASSLPLSAAVPFRRELLLLWSLSGLSFFLSPKKGMEKTGKQRYNTK